MLTQGVYSLSDVARLTDVPYATIRTWFKQRPDHLGLGPLFSTDYRHDEGDYPVSFLNLIEAYTAKFFKDKGVKPHRIRAAYQKLKRELGDHPFAREGLRTDGVEVLRKIAEDSDDAALVEVVSEQKLLLFLNHLHTIEYYDAPDHLAKLWNISTGVIVHPGANLGKPVLQNKYISTSIIAKQYKANNKNSSLVARLFDISVTDVEHAWQFENSRQRRRKHAA